MKGHNIYHTESTGMKGEKEHFNVFLAARFFAMMIIIYQFCYFLLRKALSVIRRLIS